MATDPVCGMTVGEQAAAGTLVHGGDTYFFCSTSCLEAFRANPAAYVRADPPAGATAAGHGHAMPASPAPGAKAARELAKDPICGMLVEKATALKSERAGRTYYFCSADCQRTFESPEQELKSMKTRVMIALTGVLALTAGATIVTRAPIPQLPWFTG